MALRRGLLAAVLLLLLASVAAPASAAPDMSIISYNEEHGARGLERAEAEVRAMYDLWLAEHGRGASSSHDNALGERERRFRVFWDNLRFVDAHNARAVGERGYRLGMNQFADLTNDEFRAAYLGARLPARAGGGRAAGERYRHDGVEALPENVDWREKGAVAPVKNQGQCGEKSRPLSFFDFTVTNCYYYCCCYQLLDAIWTIPSDLCTPISYRIF
jgi:hypothetical protein